MKPQPLQKLNLERSLEAFKDVELTEAEIQEALMVARQKKSAEIKRQEYAKKVFQEPVYTVPNAEEMMQTFEDLKKPDGITPLYNLDEYNREIFWNLCLYFTKDERSIHDLNKGLLLFGNVGCGKTTFMDYFKFNPNCSYVIKSCREVTFQFVEHGHELIRKYSNLWKFNEPHKSYGQKEIGYCFDDLGTEVDKKNYGNQSNVMADILLNVYDRLESMRGKVHITTNLTVTEIEDKYGSRVKSRMKEMFNIVEFNEAAPDRRK